MNILDFIKDKKARPDFREFVRVIRGECVPRRVHWAELLVDREIIAWITQNIFEEPAVPLTREGRQEYLNQYVQWWYRMGYDYCMMIDLPGIGLEFSGKSRSGTDQASLSRGERVWVEEGQGVIAGWDDFERYPWPDPETIDLSPYEVVSSLLPEGMSMLIAGASGVFEIVSENLLGLTGLSYLLHDDPALVRAVFERVGETVVGFYRNLTDLPGFGGFFQGDDLGYKTATILAPSVLEDLVLPWHRTIAQLSHEKNGVYFLHSCGDIFPLMDRLIDEVGIDAYHSFQDTILPVTDFKKQYGQRVGTLGGIDLDTLIRLDELPLRSFIRSVLRDCHESGRYALGSGNSIANYVPVSNYLIMLEEGLNYSGNPAL